MRSFGFFSKASSKKVSLSTASRRIESPEIDRTIESAAEIIEKWSTEYSASSNFYSLFSESKRDAKEFIKRVKDLQKAIDLLVLEDPNSMQLVRARDLMNIAMKRLKMEFYQILSMSRAHLDSSSVLSRSSSSSVGSSTFGSPDNESVHHARDSIISVEDVSRSTMADLKSIAEGMFAAGYIEECVSVYKTIRKSIIDEGIYRLGVEKINSWKMKKLGWEVIELKTNSWLEAVKVGMKTLFNGERILCDYIFEFSDPIRESCFSDISKDGALLLFEFPEIVAAKDKNNSPPEKIFRLLDMYCGIIENLDEIKSIFSFQSEVLSQAFNSLIRLSETIRSLVQDFESGIQKDTSKTVVPGGGVHPLTISAMDYLSLLSDYRNVLAKILLPLPSVDRSLLPESYFNASELNGFPESELKIRFAWLILVLMCKVDAKSELYKDLSVQYLFLANNVLHVVSCVHSSSLETLLGHKWIAANYSKAKQFAASWERLAWGPVMASLPENPSAAEISPGEVKERLKTFCTRFESAYKKQSGCVVPDPKLRDEMRKSIANKLEPIYREFYLSHGSKAGTKVESIAKFTPDDIRICVSELFLGKGTTENSYATLSPVTSFSSNISPTSPRRNSRSQSCRRF